MPGVLSILHRISGVILLAALPASLAALHCSVISAEGYAAVGEWLAKPWVKIFVLGAGWSVCHHVCAGVRFLLLDFHIGVSLEAARVTAALAFLASIGLTAAFAVWLWS